jgi:hypothetical protein
MKWTIIILCMLIPAFGNVYTCSISPDKSIDPQIESCKLEILQHECEKRGVNVVSNSTTENFTMIRDRIKTHSVCRDLKFTVTEAELNKYGDQIRVSYVMDGKNLAAEQLSYQQWSDLGAVQSKTKANVGATQREDSTMLINLSANVQIDSREVKNTVQEVKNKTIFLLSNLLSD